MDNFLWYTVYMEKDIIKIKLFCSCGASMLRTIVVTEPKCFECKRKRHAERSIRVYKEKQKMRTLSEDNDTHLLSKNVV